MELLPGLAISWENPDPLTYIFHLRKGVKWHNGQEFTSEDVKFSFDRILDPKVGSPIAKIFKTVQKIEAPDKYTVKITLKDTFPDFLRYAAFIRNSAIVCKSEVLKHGSLQKVMVGTGPFKLEEYKHGVGATFVRNPDYWDKPLPYLDGFKFVVVKDEASRLAGIRKKIYDIGWVKGIQLANLAKKEPHITISKSSEDRQGRMFINHSRFPFNNLKLRQAVASCIDRRAIINHVLLGDGVLATIIPPVSVPFVLPQNEIANLPYYKQDYELAKKLLKEGGYPDGFEFTIKTSPHSPDYVPASEIIAQQCAKVGIKVKIRQMDWGVFQKVRRSKDYQATYYAGSWRASPIGYFYRYMRGGQKADETLQNDPEINKLMDLTMTEPDLEKRKKIFKELQYKTADTVTVIIPYAMSGRFEMVNKKIKGYHFMANRGRAYLRQAWISE
jgi:peptide/nickel transport system substrate-binding protein